LTRVYVQLCQYGLFATRPKCWTSFSLRGTFTSHRNIRFRVECLDFAETRIIMYLNRSCVYIYSYTCTFSPKKLAQVPSRLWRSANVSASNIFKNIYRSRHSELLQSFWLLFVVPYATWERDRIDIDLMRDSIRAIKIVRREKCSTYTSFKNVWISSPSICSINLKVRYQIGAVSQSFFLLQFVYEL